MLNVATTREMPAKVSSAFSKKPRKSAWISSSISAVSSVPVRASAPAGSSGSMRDTSSCWLTPSSAATRMLMACPGSGSSRRSASSALNAA